MDLEVGHLPLRVIQIGLVVKQHMKKQIRDISIQLKVSLGSQ